MKMELTEGSETSAYINQTPGNYPKGNLLYSVHGESLKSRKYKTFKRNMLHDATSIPKDYMVYYSKNENDYEGKNRPMM